MVPVPVVAITTLPELVGLTVTPVPAKVAGPLAVNTPGELIVTLALKTAAAPNVAGAVLENENVPLVNVVVLPPESQVPPQHSPPVAPVAPVWPLAPVAPVVPVCPVCPVCPVAPGMPGPSHVPEADARAASDVDQRASAASPGGKGC